MEVDRNKYPKQLLSILKGISNASFISFDLEMSGISTRPRRGNNGAALDAGKLTLQQQYIESKEAAETFQVLQVGITIVEEDREKGLYVARPYNFYLSPLFLHGDRLNIDRKFGFSSSACDFLLKNHFRFGKVFNEGVPYLSREEEQYAREHFQNVNGPIKREDIVISPNEPQTFEFYRKARKTITAWINEKSESKQDFVNISNPDGPLNGFQRRLIHQLVQNEFPDYRTFARHEKSFMQVEKIDHKREAEIQRRRLAEFNTMVVKQVGLRWIFEALCGGDLTKIDPWWFCDEENEQTNDQETRKSLESEFREVTRFLKEKKHVLIGHNLFTDLVFLYKTFVGELPLQVREFQKRIHLLFPFVVDTKYLATHDADAMNPRGGLRQLWEPFRMSHQPMVVLAEEHMSYGSVFGKDHEAGFDSWMTADLFIKLTAQIHAKQGDLESSTDGSTNSDSSESLASDGESDDDGSETELTGGVALNAPDTDGVETGDSLSSDDATQPSDLSVKIVKSTSQWLPRLDGWFWTIYGNKLRVNSTEDGVCRLSLVDTQ